MMSSTYTGGIFAGQRFGRLVAVELAEHRQRQKNKGYYAYWKVVCDCGEERLVEAGNLRHRQRSCGCLRTDLAGSQSITHGKSGSPIYAVWNAMYGRCCTPSNTSYDNYGGRGVRLCERWHKFENFYADMGDPPFKGASIDRIDADGDYSPENCRWADRSEQARNTRVARLITYIGVTQHMFAWCDEFDISYSAMTNATVQETDLAVALHRRVLQKVFDIPLKDTRHFTVSDLPSNSGQPLH